MSRSPAKSGKAIATKSLKEKWLSIVQSAREKGENGIGGFSTITQLRCHCCFHTASHCHPIAECADHAGSRISCFPPPLPFLFHAHSCCSQSMATAIPCHPFPFMLTLSGRPRLTKHEPTSSSLWTTATSPTETHNAAHRDLPLPVSPPQEALV